MLITVCAYILHLYILESIDYVCGSCSVKFIAGTTSSSFDVALIDNNVYRGNVYFYISINPLSLPAVAINGRTNYAEVIIIDDDCKYIRNSLKPCNFNTRE